MLNLSSRLAAWLAPARTAHAHCDIPCGIYDPHEAEIAAQTVEKMVTLFNDLGQDTGAAEWRNSAARYIATKELHAEKVKREVLIIWGDYFKPDHLATIGTDIHERVWALVKLAGYNKHHVDAAKAAELRASVREFADLFWKTKGGRPA